VIETSVFITGNTVFQLACGSVLRYLLAIKHPDSFFLKDINASNWLHPRAGSNSLSEVFVSDLYFVR